MIPLKELHYNLNKKEFRDAVKRYDWEIADMPTVCTCGDQFTVDHAMICRRGGFITQRHNELRDLELLSTVCNDVEGEPVLQKGPGEILNDGANKAPDARLDTHARGFWEKQSSAFLDVRVCHPNADSYKDLRPNLNQIYRQHENEKKRKYASRVLEIEHGTFTPLVFTTTGGMAAECLRYHSRLADLIADKKAESYANTISWIRAKVSFAILRSAILCLRGSRSRRRSPLNITDHDMNLDNI